MQSQQQIEKLDLEGSAWDRLQYAYENCKANQYVEGHYGKYENGKLSVCGIGWAMKGAGYTDEQILSKSGNPVCMVKTMLNVNIQPTGILSEYGFTKDEMRKFRRCPGEDCAASGPLRYILEHLNEDHKFPIPMIGKLIPVIKNDTKPLPTLADKVVNLKNNIVKSFTEDRD